MKYKQRLGVLEAIQYTGGNLAEIAAWCPYAQASGGNIALDIPGQSSVTIVANEWIVRTSRNAFAPGRAQDFGYLPFGELYESVKGDGVSAVADVPAMPPAITADLFLDLAGQTIGAPLTAGIMLAGTKGTLPGGVGWGSTPLPLVNIKVGANQIVRRSPIKIGATTYNPSTSDLSLR
jgi:hypothetical protein